MKRRVLDVSGLGTTEFGPRDPLWWGVILAVAIEATMLALLAIAYFYVADRTHPFPPAHIPKSIAWVMTAEAALWVIGCVPQHMSSRTAIRGDLRATRTWLLITVALAVVSVALRFWILHALPFRWDAHAYGSVVWGLLGIQLVHGLTAIGEDGLYCVLLFTGPAEDKHRVDIQVSSALTYFTAAGAVLIWAVVFLEILVGGGR